jgi:RHS repeat-associated protein
LAAKYLYDPFGNMLAMSGPLMNLNKFRFSSEEWNENSALYYYLYRFYDPALQRWPNRDPLGESGFETLRRGVPIVIRDGFNVYSFVDNNPIISYDPDGLVTSEECDEQYDEDIATCRTLRTRRQRALCYSKAFSFYAACIAAATTEKAACWCESHPAECALIILPIILTPPPVPVPE